MTQWFNRIKQRVARKARRTLRRIEGRARRFRSRPDRYCLRLLAVYRELRASGRLVYPLPPNVYVQGDPLPVFHDHDAKKKERASRSLPFSRVFMSAGPPRRTAKRRRHLMDSSPRLTMLIQAGGSGCRPQPPSAARR
jgi:hypothetical protein